MVNFCAVFGCSNNSSRDNDKNYYVFRRVISHCGPQTAELSKKRQDMWVAALSRDDLRMDKLSSYRICSDHFITGMLLQIYIKSCIKYATL